MNYNKCLLPIIDFFQQKTSHHLKNLQQTTLFFTILPSPNTSIQKQKSKLTFMLERRTGDSKNDVGLNPGGTVTHGDREIGSFAGDKSLYLAIELTPDTVGFASSWTSGLELESPELVVAASIATVVSPRVKIEEKWRRV